MRVRFYILEQLFRIWAFPIIGILVLVSLDPAIIFIYLSVIIFSLAYRKYFNEIVLVYFVSFLFLYPNVATSLTSYINSKAILLGFSGFVFYLIYRRKCNYYLQENKVLKRIILLWFFWGSFVYSIVLIGYLLFEFSGINIMEFFGYPPPHTSHIEHYIKTIQVVFLVLAPILSINKKESFKKLLSLYVVLLAINACYALLQYKVGIQIIEESYTLGFRHGNPYGEQRLFSFSYTDPIGFGRMISFPILLLISYLLIVRKKGKAVYTLILSLGILALLLTFGRTAYVSTVAGFCVVLFLIEKNVKKVMKYSIIILLMIAIIYGANIPSYFSSVPRLANTVGTLETRLYRRHAIAAYFIKTNPLFGAFPGQMIMLSKTMGPREIDRSAHSLYLQTGVDYGIPMMLIIVFVLIYSFWVGRSLLKKYKYLLSLKENHYIAVFIIASTAHAISIMVHGITETVPYVFIFLNLGYIIAARNILKRQVYQSRSFSVPIQRQPVHIGMPDHGLK